MNEGASACAGGVPGACDKVIYPDYLYPGIILLALLLVVLLVLERKKVIKLNIKYLLLIWATLALLFIGSILVNKETVAEQTKKAQMNCKSTDIGTCEY